MAIVIEANYGKKIGLPQFSSHSFQVAVKSEVQTLSEIAQEVERLYRILQESVDQNIREAGVTPETLQSAKPAPIPAPAEQRRSVGNVGTKEPQCSPKQWAYIEDLVRRSSVRLEDVEDLADRMFHKSLEELNRLEASGLIDEVKQLAGQKSNGYVRGGNNNWRRVPA